MAGFAVRMRIHDMAAQASDPGAFGARRFVGRNLAVGEFDNLRGRRKGGIREARLCARRGGRRRPGL